MQKSDDLNLSCLKNKIWPVKYKANGKVYIALDIFRTGLLEKLFAHKVLRNTHAQGGIIAVSYNTVLPVSNRTGILLGEAKLIDRSQERKGVCTS